MRPPARRPWIALASGALLAGLFLAEPAVAQSSTPGRDSLQAWLRRRDSLQMWRDQLQARIDSVVLAREAAPAAPPAPVRRDSAPLQAPRPAAPVRRDTTPARPATPGNSAPPQLVIGPPPAMAPVTASMEEQAAFMTTAARAAWNYVSRETSRLGFVGATKEYPYLTVWDMASGLASAWSARELGFIDAAAYRQYAARTLASLAAVPLYRGGAFNRQYGAVSGAIVNRDAKVDPRGMGFSSLDHGRLLIWLKIVADSDPTLAAAARKVVDRLDMRRITGGGYMYGENISRSDSLQRYQEGRVGYEQYAAQGFELWNAPVENARYFFINGRPIDIYGRTLLADRRGRDVMTSEPFIMMGLELGWPNDQWRNLSLHALSVQEERFKRTGIITMVSEDAIPVAPAYFYYYLLHQDGKPFVVTTVTGLASDTFPRWVSAKAAFGYHALAPSAYTWRTLQAVRPAGSANGWTAGVYEGTARPTGTYNVNTAALVLESAAYMKRGCAFIQKTCPATPAQGTSSTR